MANIYDIGDKVRVEVSFSDNSVLTDPTAVTFKIKDPAGVTTTYVHGVGVELVKDGVGEYHIDYTLLLSGRYDYRFAGTGSIVAADEDHFYVRLSEF